MNNETRNKEIEKSKELIKAIRNELDNFVYPITLIAWPKDEKGIENKKVQK